MQAPVIYRHFGSREGLVQSAYLARFLEVLDLEYALFDAAAQQATSADDFRSAFDDLVTKMLGEEHRAANLTRLEVLAMATSRPELADAIIAAQTSAFARSVPALDHAQQQGWIRSDIDTTEYAVWAVSSTLGRAMIVRFVDHPGMDDRWAVMHHRAVSAVLFGD